MRTKRPIVLSVNGRPRDIEVAPHHTLLEVLRDDLEIIAMFKASAVDDRLGVPVRLDGDEIYYAYPVAILAATRPA